MQIWGKRKASRIKNNIENKGKQLFFIMVGYERYPASSRALFYGNEKMIRPEYQFWLVSDIRRLVYQEFLHVLLAVTRMFCTTPFC